MFIKDHNKTALIYNNKEISYNTLLKQVGYYSSLYKCKKGDRVAIFSEAQPGWYFAFYSIWKNNGIAVPYDAMAPVDDIAFQIADCKPTTIFCSKKTEPVLKAAIKKSKVKTKVIVFEKIKSDKKLLSKYEAEGIPKKDIERTAVMIYTSGTTGKPKGVMLTYKNLLSNIEKLADVEKNGKKETYFLKEDVSLTILPLQHILPLQATILMPMHVGATICILKELNSEEIISTMQKWSVTFVIGVPRLYKMFHTAIIEKINSSGIAKLLLNISRLLKSLKFAKKIFKKVGDRFGGHIRYFLSGGSKIDPQIMKDFYALGIPMYEGYGLSETSPVITKNDENKYLSTVGKPINGVEAKIVNEEIVVKGDNVMKGYYKRPKETAEVLRNGWFYTGDRGSIDRHGNIIITGRIKDIIVLSNGKNIDPTEVELKLASAYPSIQEIGLIESKGQLMAVIQPNIKYLHENKIYHINEHFKWDVLGKYNLEVSDYKKIFQFEVINEDFPRTRIGKLKRFELKKMIESPKKSKKAVNKPTGVEYKIIHEYIENKLKLPISPDDHIEMDLGLDSLDRLQFLEKINQTFGINLTNKDFSKYPILKNLAEYIKKIKTKISEKKVEWGKILRKKINFSIPPKHWIMNLYVFLTKPLVKLYFRFKTIGKKNIPQDKAVIIAPNHQSFLDGLLVSMSLKHKTRNKTYFIAKEDHFLSKRKKRLAEKANILIININDNITAILQKASLLLEKGRNIVIFPEGTRSRDGKMQEFKDAFAILSKELNIPVVPAVINGAYEAFPINSKFPRPKKIVLEYLEAIEPDGKSYNEIIKLTRERIGKKLKKIGK